jgi:peroxisomal membrane protein 2
LTSQKLSGQELNLRSILAYAGYGLCIGGPFAHFFYTFINNITPDGRSKKLWEFLLERFGFAPIFCVLSLYFLTLFEGKTHLQAVGNLVKLYQQVLTANWTYLTLPVFLNFYFTPPMLRVFVSNIIGFFWVIYLADKRRRAAAKKTT